LVPVLSYILSNMVERNDKIALDDTKRTVFHAQKSPLISLHRYLERVLSFSPCSNSCFIIALIYIDRIIQNNPKFVLNSLSVHRMLITSVMVATKFIDDETFNNLYYAKVGGLQVSELNKREQAYLTHIDFALPIAPTVFAKYHEELVKHFCCEGATKVPTAPLRAKLSQEIMPSKSNIPPCLSRSANSIHTPAFTVNEPSSKRKLSPLTQQTATLTQSQQTATHKDKSEQGIPACKESSLQYQAGFDYTARDMISTSNDVSSATLDFGNLAVGARPVNFQCTPTYAKNNHRHMVAVSWG